MAMAFAQPLWLAITISDATSPLWSGVDTMRTCLLLSASGGSSHMGAWYSQKGFGYIVRTDEFGFLRAPWLNKLGIPKHLTPRFGLVLSATNRPSDQPARKRWNRKLHLRTPHKRSSGWKPHWRARHNVIGFHYHVHVIIYIFTQWRTGPSAPSYGPAVVACLHWFGVTAM